MVELTPEQHKQREEYYSALGFFIQCFAEAEHLLHNLLVLYSGVDWAMGRALFSGTRVDTAIETIARIQKIRPIPKNRMVDLQYFLPHFKAISTVRNSVLHYGADVHSHDGPSITGNWRIALTEESVKSFSISSDILANMALDLLKIAAHIRCRHILVMIEIPKTVSKNTREQVTRFMLDAHKPLLDGQWRYKPGALDHRKKVEKLKKAARKPSKNNRATTNVMS